MLSPLTIQNFNGGITDFPVGAQSNQFSNADNILISRSNPAKVFSRPGSALFDSAHGQLPTGNNPNNYLGSFNEDTALIASSARRAFRYNAGWTELLGPTNNSFFSAGSTANRVSSSDWKGHLILTNDGGALPMKIYQDQSGSYKSVTLGLPKFLPSNAYSATTTVTALIRNLANDLQSKFLSHYSDSNLHINGADTVSAALLTAPNLIIGDSFLTAQTFVNQLQKAYINHYQDAASPTGSRLYHSNNFGPFSGEPNISLSTSLAPTTWLALAQILNELQVKYNWHTRGFQIHTNGNDGIPNYGIGSPSVVLQLPNTTLGPSISNALPTDLINLANEIKTVYKTHLLSSNHDTTEPGYPVAMGGQRDDTTFLPVNAFEQYSLIELAIHLCARYRFHQYDAAQKVYAIIGTSGTTVKNIIKNSSPASGVASVTGSPPRNGAIDAIITASNKIPYYDGTLMGGFVYYTTDAGDGGFYGKNFLIGTTLVAPPPVYTLANPFFTTSQNNDGTVPDGTFKVYYVSKKYFHFVTSNNSISLAGATPASFDSSLLFKDNSLIFSTLLAIANNLNVHVNDGYTHYITNSLPLTVNVNNYTDNFKTYEYAFIYSRQYTTLSGEIFRNVSAGLYQTFKVERTSPTSNINISNIPSISNGSANNYDTSNINIEIYRTINGGTSLFLVGTIPNGTTSFSDNISDVDLISKQEIYTDGGTLDNDPPPVCNVLHITQSGLPLFGNVTITLNDGTTETIVNRVMQGNIDQPDSAPYSNFVDLPNAVQGISSVRSLPIVFTKTATYRLEGAFNSQGQGNINAVTISDRIGLVGPFSPVQVDGAVIFAGPDQFYMTDGYAMTGLGRTWPTTYANLVSGSRGYNIQGAFDKLTNRVWMATTGSGTNNDSCYILDLNFPVDPIIGGAWTTASNSTSFAPTALCFFNGQMIRGDTRGYIFKHDASYTSDPKVDSTSGTLSGITKTIIYNYVSPAFNFGSDGFRKWVSIFECKFDNFGNLSAQVNSINDLGRVTASLSPIRSRQSTMEINERRYFPSGSLYCALKQIQITNAKVVITNSDTLGLATLNKAALTLTIDAGTWPTDIADHVITFVTDGYVNEYLIASQTTTILTLTDPGSTLPASGDYKWEIRGYPKTEKMQLHEYTIWSAAMGINQTTAGSETGANK